MSFVYLIGDLNQHSQLRVLEAARGCQGMLIGYMTNLVRDRRRSPGCDCFCRGVNSVTCSGVSVSPVR